MMRELILEDPDIAATDLANRLNISRPTVYRWRDDIGASRVDGRWVVNGRM